MRSSMISTLRRMPLLKTAIAGALLFAVAFLLGHTALESQALRTLSGTALILTCILIGLVAHRQSTELRNLAQTDHLTGLTNHRGFHELLTKELVRSAAGRPAAVACQHRPRRLQGCQRRHGHPYGDRVLKGVGTQLRGCIRDGDTAARVGRGIRADPARDLLRGRLRDRRAGARGDRACARARNDFTARRESPPTPLMPRTRRRSTSSRTAPFIGRRWRASAHAPL